MKSQHCVSHALGPPAKDLKGSQGRGVTSDFKGLGQEEGIRWKKLREAVPKAKQMQNQAGLFGEQQSRFAAGLELDGRGS